MNVTRRSRRAFETEADYAVFCLEAERDDLAAIVRRLIEESRALQQQLAGAVDRIRELEQALDRAADDLRAEGHYEAAGRAFMPLETGRGQ